MYLRIYLGGEFMQTVYLIDDDDSLKKKLNEIFKQDKNLKFKQIKTENRLDYTGTREELISMGYEPCKNCNP